MNAFPSSDPDTPLVARFLRDRSGSAFDALYARHGRRVYGLVIRLLGPLRDHADDVFQETWMRAIQRLPEFGGRSRFATWLCGIAVNCCREERRRRAAAPPDGATWDPLADDARDGRPAADPAGAVDLARAIERLAPGYREVLVLHDLHGFTHEEIAAHLGVEPGTSKSQLSRARRAVREALGARVRVADGAGHEVFE